MEIDLNKIREQFLLTDDEFERYYEEVKKNLIKNNKPSKDRKMIIIGGQSGAGKTKLWPIANKDLGDNGVIVDFDELRSYHPNFKQVSKMYLEKTHTILHPDVEKVKNRILDYLRENNYNVIYEGSLRNTQGFIDFSKDFQKAGYEIDLYIMSVPELESFSSTYKRYVDDLLADNNPRWVEKIAHDESYKGTIRTVKEFERRKISSKTKVFIRGEDVPQEIYSTEGKQFPTSIQAINYGRELHREKSIDDFWDKYVYVYKNLRKHKPELIDKLKDWEEMFKKEYSKVFENKKDRTRE